jgi:hypothetical protein
MTIEGVRELQAGAGSGISALSGTKDGIRAHWQDSHPDKRSSFELDY